MEEVLLTCTRLCGNKFSHGNVGLNHRLNYPDYYKRTMKKGRSRHMQQFSTGKGLKVESIFLLDQYLLKRMGTRERRNDMK